MDPEPYSEYGSGSSCSDLEFFFLNPFSQPTFAFPTQYQGTRYRYSPSPINILYAELGGVP